MKDAVKRERRALRRAGRVGIAAGAYGRLSIRRAGPARAPGVALPEAAQAEVAESIVSAAQALDTAACDDVRVVAGGDVEVVHTRKGAVLTIGLGWCAARPVDARDAVLRALLLDRARGGAKGARVRAKLERAGGDGEAERVDGGVARVVASSHEKREATAAEVADRSWRTFLGDAAAERAVEVAGRVAGFDEFWEASVEPCLEAGVVPPILEGWDTLLAADDDDRKRRRLVPVRDAQELETRLLEDLLGDEQAQALTPVAWDAAGTAVYVPQMRQGVAADADVLPRFTPLGLPEILRVVPRELEAESYVELIAATLIIGLIDDHGWSLAARPGEPLKLVGPDAALAPFELCDRLSAATSEDEGWRRFAKSIRISDLVFDPVALSEGVELAEPEEAGDEADTAVADGASDS